MEFGNESKVLGIDPGSKDTLYVSTSFAGDNKESKARVRAGQTRREEASSGARTYVDIRIEHVAGKDYSSWLEFFSERLYRRIEAARGRINR